jgi:hypothetical protein
MLSRKMKWTGVALGVALAMGVSALSIAQTRNSPTATAAGDQNPPQNRGGGGFRGGPAADTPGKVAQVLKWVLLQGGW